MNRVAAAIPHWQELGRTTLGSGNTDITVSSLTNKPYLMLLDHTFSSLQTGPSYRFNSDTGTNYAYRKSGNGGADGTFTSINRIAYDATGDANDKFTVAFVNNISSKEKLVIGHLNQRSSAGAGNANDRSEFVGKWANTSDAISSVTQHNGDGNNYDTGSELVVLGYDPADTTGTNAWEELASVELGSAGDTLDSGTITAKKYLMYEVFIVPSGSTRTTFRFNSDSGSNYAHRDSNNGGSDATKTSRTSIEAGAGDNNHNSYHIGYIINKSDKEKLMINHNMKNGGNGAGNAPARKEDVAKWSNTSTQITSIQAINDQAGNYGIGSRIKVWGFD